MSHPYLEFFQKKYRNLMSADNFKLYSNITQYMLSLRKRSFTIILVDGLSVNYDTQQEKSIIHIFDEFLNFQGHTGKLILIEQDPEAVNMLAKTTSDKAHIFSGSLVSVLHGLAASIPEDVDFMYLGSEDPELNNPNPSNMSSIKLGTAIESVLSDKTLLLADSGAKGEKEIQFLEECVLTPNSKKVIETPSFVGWVV